MFIPVNVNMIKISHSISTEGKAWNDDAKLLPIRSGWWFFMLFCCSPLYNQCWSYRCHRALQYRHATWCHCCIELWLLGILMSRFGWLVGQSILFQCYSIVASHTHTLTHNTLWHLQSLCLPTMAPLSHCNDQSAFSAFSHVQSTLLLSPWSPGPSAPILIHTNTHITIVFHASKDYSFLSARVSSESQTHESFACLHDWHFALPIKPIQTCGL